jgi:repressor LexA
VAGSALIAQGIDKRRQILRFIRDYQRRQGMAPTIAEITNAMGYASKNAVRTHLQQLAQEGWVTFEHYRHRSLRVLKSGRYPR